MSDYEPLGPTAGIPLETHVKELRGRCEASARVQGCPTHYWEELRLFREYAKERDLYLQHQPEEIAGRNPDEECNEHQVWFVRGSQWVIKVTWPDNFGLLVLYRSDEEERASPIAYLERWHLHNELFGDNVGFIGALEEGGKLQLVIEQPAIKGEPASLAQIHDFFVNSGWKRFSVGGDVAYFDAERNVVISDTHRGNLILMEDGLLAPIDLRVQPLSGALLDYVVKACRA